MSRIQRKFKRRASNAHPAHTTERGYMLGSHIRKGLYEPVSQEISGLMRGTYDDPNTPHNEVDALASYKMDKFEKAMYVRRSADNPTPGPAEPPKEPKEV